MGDLMMTTYKQQQSMHRHSNKQNFATNQMVFESKQISFEQSKESQSITPMDAEEMNAMILECEPVKIRKNDSIVFDLNNMEESAKRNSISTTIGTGVSPIPATINMKKPTFEHTDSMQITHDDVKDLAIYQSLVYENNQLMLKVNQSNTVLQHNLNQIDLAQITE